ncbi:ABC transporter substrate-binding protein [Rugosimonospora africana]|uniref:ABC transporter permease n=1 Tax=Rugosimonospora africana TaxID=556532 RepID=A0A8J3R4B6_9ACTN|nr:ABC transporter substrate-binding protein [Rugosimonospora africana]GIH19806.1 ABC transporter permease [Rugosimonospora africana]
MRTIRIRKPLALAAAALVLAGCGGGGPRGGGGSKLTDGKIVLGVLNDQSGGYADLGGKNAVVAVQLAIDDFKAKYGAKAVTKDITVVTADHQNKPDVAKTDAQQMYDRQGVDAIFDVPTSSAALAVADVAKQDKRLYFNISAASDDLNGKSCNKFTFHYAYDTNMLANGTGAADTEGGARNWYLVYPNYAFGQDMTRGFTQAVSKAGGHVVATAGSPFPNPTEDYSSLLLKAASLNPKPDTLGVMQAGADLQNVVKQYNQFKLKDRGIKLAVGLMFITDIHSLGPDALAGTTFTDAWYWNFDQTNRSFANRFYAKTQTRPTFAHAANYSAALNYLEAVQAAGTDDAATVVGNLEGKKINDVFLRNGTVRAADHLVTHDAYLAQVKPSSQVAEPWDYEKIIKTIPADQAFNPPSGDCHL